MLQVRRILWAALYGASFLYIVVLFLAKPEVTAPPDPSLPFILAAVAFGSILVAFILPPRLAAQAFASIAFATTEAASFSDLPAGTKSFADPAAARTRAAGVLQTTFILRMAMFESVALYGLVLGFLGHPIAAWAGYFGVAWILMATQFPTQAKDDAALTKATGIVFR